MSKSAAIIERRLRLLFAREFASRGYYFEAETYFSCLQRSQLDPEELLLMARIACATNRFDCATQLVERLVELQPTNSSAIEFLKLLNQRKVPFWRKLFRSKNELKIEAK